MPKGRRFFCPRGMANTSPSIPKLKNTSALPGLRNQSSSHRWKTRLYSRSICPFSQPLLQILANAQTFKGLLNLKKAVWLR